MTLSDVPRHRLLNQQIAETTLKESEEVVRWMGAMQAQDFNMAKWAVGVRLVHPTDSLVSDAFEKGRILRTHLLRPTWHFVSAADIYWMLELSAPQIKTAMKSRWKELELDETTCKKSIKIIEKKLAGGIHLTREALMAELEKARISTAGQRSAHIMLYAELEQVVCSGIPSGKQQTYALLSQRVPRKKNMVREEALGVLAHRYFSSRGPATIADFSRWSGLSITNAKKAVEIVKAEFSQMVVEGQNYLYPSAASDITTKKSSVHLLPAFDEFIIGYSDRSAVLPHKSFSKVVSSNGIFWPAIVVDGQVAGVWKRTVKTKKVEIEAEYFKKPNKSISKLIKKAADEFGLFLGLDTELIEKNK